MERIPNRKGSGNPTMRRKQLAISLLFPSTAKAFELTRSIFGPDSDLGFAHSRIGTFLRLLTLRIFKRGL